LGQRIRHTTLIAQALKYALTESGGRTEIPETIAVQNVKNAAVT